MSRIRKALLCLVLGTASLMGTAMRPDEIEELMQVMNRAKVAHSVRKDESNGDDRVPKLPGRW